MNKSPENIRTYFIRLVVMLMVTSIVLFSYVDVVGATELVPCESTATVQIDGALLPRYNDAYLQLTTVQSQESPQEMVEYEVRGYLNSGKLGAVPVVTGEIAYPSSFKVLLNGGGLFLLKNQSKCSRAPYPLLEYTQAGE